METIESMMEAILNSRELCGDEREAAIEACYEEAGRAPTGAELLEAFQAARVGWAAYQAQAGVVEKYRDGLGGLHNPAVHKALRHGS